MTSIAIKHPLDDTSAMREKVENDIAFLTDKIDRMMHQSRPNQMLIEHYMEMLKSRQAVHNWLMDGVIQNTPNSNVA
ncbi:MAG: hypothetical protein IPK77_07515 [Cellvibrio sp.]|jgi:hypothetical protein|nr:hypothetical protein [Cellvibrio sp.]